MKNHQFSKVLLWSTFSWHLMKGSKTVLCVLSNQESWQETKHPSRNASQSSAYTCKPEDGSLERQPKCTSTMAQFPLWWWAHLDSLLRRQQQQNLPEKHSFSVFSPIPFSYFWTCFQSCRDNYQLSIKYCIHIKVSNTIDNTSERKAIH